MRIYAIILFFWLPFLTAGQTVRDPISAVYLGLGAYSNNSIDIFSFQANEASLAKMNKISAGVYGEKRFLLDNLGLCDVALAVPTSSGGFALDGKYFGFSGYTESQLGIAYARSLGSKADVGVQFNYYTVHIAGYGNASTVNFELGTILHLTDHLNTGLHVYNPLAGKLGSDVQEKLASIYSAGIGYEASKNFFIRIEIQKQEDKPVNVNAGLQYGLLPQLLARLGISAATSTMYLGIGFKRRHMRLDATASYHPELGLTPGVLLIVFLSRTGAIKIENE